MERLQAAHRGRRLSTVFLPPWMCARTCPACQFSKVMASLQHQHRPSIDRPIYLRQVMCRILAGIAFRLTGQIKCPGVPLGTIFLTSSTPESESEGELISEWELDGELISEWE